MNMAHRNTLDPDQLTDQARRARSIGPSDSSDSGSDLAGVEDLDADDTSDRHGTGDRPSADEESDVLPDSDIAPDRIVRAEEAGLGGGLDQAEEAQLGVTDEELKERMRRR
jgi:hypothetical protein